jgi:hypothetical protein
VAASRVSLSPEARLLLLTAAVSPSEAALRSAVSAGIDWENLSALARHEKATPVLVRQLSRASAGAESPQYRELRQLATISAMEMLQLEQLLYETLDLFARHGIEAVLLKGAGLAYTAYSSFADRPMGDLDLLVRRQDAERAWSLLRERGWTPRPTDGDPARYATHHHLAPLIRESERFRLELHTEVLPGEHPFRFSTDAVWRGALRITVNGRVVTVPTPLHQLWHACVHFAWSHALQWGAWRTLRDSAAIIQRGGFEWTDFVGLARETRAGTCCFWTLRLTQRLTGAAVPDHVLTSLRPPYPEFIIGRLERHFISSLFPSEDRCPSVWLTRRLWEAGVSPRWSRHGAARPWHVSERWLAASGRATSEQPGGSAVNGWFKRIRAGIVYLLRLSRFSLPNNAANIRTSV